ncbi:MAG: 4'-phosphopantetheinyl transferase superfamily protein [Arenimonas sp.]
MPNWPSNSQSINRIVAVQIASLHDLSAVSDERNANWLTDSELARYQSISASNRKKQFLAGHFLVRKMASDIFGNLSADWTYIQDAENHRRLKCNQDGLPELFCSISHSGEWVTASVSETPVGIDIETFDRQRDFIAIARHVFSRDEVFQLEKCDAQELKKAFYLHWTLKESIAKQYGAGLKFEISRSHQPVRVSDTATAALHSWQCLDYVVSLACDTENEIRTSGLCEDAIYQAWQNIPVTLPT